jgi:hypothetical protein
MAETLISPGVLARENDQSFIQGQPVEAGAAIVGPAVKGPVGIPTLVTSFSEYQSVFGGAVSSGSSEYTYLTSISANNYFSQGGNSLLVTRVQSGSFTGASSLNIRNNEETGELSLGTLTVGSGGSNGTPGIYTDVATTSGNGSGATVTVVTSRDNGKVLTGIDELLTSITNNPTDCNDNIFNISPEDGSGTGLTLSVTTVGSTISTIQVTNAGSGYVAGDILTIKGADIESTSEEDATILLQEDDILVEATSVTVTNAGSGYEIGDTLTVALANIGTTDADLATSALAGGNIVNGVPFVLETLAEGVVMNNSGAEVGNGALANGTRDNVRWEIASSNSGSGVFSLIIRKGSDTHKNKSILETWGNLSLDPKAPNYIERVIGNTSYSIVEDGSDSYVQSSGEYSNKSKYVRVSAVNYKTSEYFDNAGNAKAAFTSSLPQIGSGSFSGATGELFGAGAKFYDEI